MKELFDGLMENEKIEKLPRVEILANGEMVSGIDGRRYASGYLFTHSGTEMFRVYEDKTVEWI